jgi:TolB-like protein
MLAVLIVFFTFPVESQTAAINNSIKTIAILPFQINSSQDLSYIKNGMLHMFNSRLSWREKVNVISENQIKNQISDSKHLSGNKFIYNVGQQTHSDYIISGSVTELSGSFSIDARVYDIKNRRYMPFSEHSGKIDELIKKTDRIAARINKKVFERATASWKNIEKEKQEYINKLKRQNPEHLIPNRQWDNTEESPGWKIWKHLF